jgi:hypothetical protein
MAQIRVTTNRLINTDLGCYKTECRRKCLDLIGSNIRLKENCKMSNFMIFMCCQTLIRISNQGRLAWMGYVTDMEINMHAKFSWKNLKQLASKPRHSWEDDIKVDLKEIGWRGDKWIHLAQDRDQQWVLESTVISIQVP